MPQLIREVTQRLGLLSIALTLLNSGISQSELKETSIEKSNFSRATGTSISESSRQDFYDLKIERIRSGKDEENKTPEVSMIRLLPGLPGIIGTEKGNRRRTYFAQSDTTVIGKTKITFKVTESNLEGGSKTDEASAVLSTSFFVENGVTVIAGTVSDFEFQSNALYKVTATRVSLSNR